MATTHTISRRKLATYGKTSRKPRCHDITSSAIGPLPSTVDVPTPRQEITCSKSNDTDDLLPSRNQGRSFKQAGSLRESNNPQAEINHPRNLGDNRLTRRRGEDTTTWDVSSSDDAGTSDCYVATRLKKRLRTSPPPSGATANKKVLQRRQMVEDGGPWPPTLAAKMSADSREYPALCQDSSKARADNFYQTSLSTSTEGASVPHRKQISKTLSSNLSRSTPLTSFSRAEKTHARSGRIKGITSSAFDNSDSAESPSPPTPRTPTHAKGSAEATTPRQKELWSMLLPQSLQDVSLAAMDSLEQDTRDKPHKDGILKTVQSTDASRRNSTPRTKSRRLIDRLHPATQRFQAPFNFSHCDETLSDSDRDSTSNSDEQVPPTFKNSRSLSNKTLKVSTIGSTSPPPNRQHRLLPRNGLKVTYLSHRSHLANESLEGNLSSKVPFPDDGMTPDDAFTKKQSRNRAPSMDPGEVDDPRIPDPDGSQSSSMRTIHELRGAGESVRQLNDLEALFDEMDGPGRIPMNLRRSKLFELSSKLQEPAYCRLLLDQGYGHRLLAMSDLKEDDAVTGTIVAATTISLIAAPSGVQANSLMNDPRIAELFATRLKDDQDLMNIAHNRRSNISKRGQSELSEYVKNLLRSNVWRSGAPTFLSGRVVGLQGLDYLVRRGRELGCKARILPASIAGRLIAIMPLVGDKSTFNLGANQLVETRLVISILESSTISGASHNDSQWSAVTLAPLLAILPWLNNLSLMRDEETTRLVLRLYLNLTNNNPRLCHEFAGPDIIQAILDVIQSHFQILSGPEQRASSLALLDTLILALGTLINLVEWSSAVRRTMTTDTDRGECYLGILVRLFIARRKVVAETYSEEETSSNVAFGYLSVLLAYLSVDEEARVLIVSHLEGGNLQLLLDAVEEFVQYHRQIDEDLDVKEGEMDLRTSFISRLESVLGRLRDAA